MPPIPDATARQGYAPLWNLIRTGRPSRRRLAAATAIAVISTIGTLYFPILTRHVVDSLGADRGDRFDLAALAIVLVSSTLASAVSAYLLATVGYRLVATLRRTLTSKMFRLPVPSFDRETTGARVSRIISDCESISELATRQAINLVTSTLMLLGSVVVLVILDLRMTLTLLGCVVAAFAVVVPLTLQLDGRFRQIQDRTAKLGGILTHVFAEIRLVKAFTAEARETTRSRAEVESIEHLGCQVARINAALTPLVGLAISIAIVVILVYGTVRVSHHDVTIGTLTAFILYIFNVSTPLVQLVNFAAELQKAKGASSRITAILGEPEEATAGNGAIVEVRRGVLEFRAVAFSYPGREQPVLRGIDLAFAPRTTTALVGASGNGKTTVLSLIERFYEPTAGEIVHDGTPIRDIPLAAWRSRIGYVAQGSPIMPGTVRDNIAYGVAGCSDELVRSAAERAGALSFIERMPQGFDTHLIEQGNNLSGGQRQRIAIARMFLRNPDILILDEATSNLDSETEHQIQIALRSLMTGRTNIVVAHRLSTVMHADRIYILDDGQVSGEGSHSELVASHAQYARLVEFQFRRQRPTDDERGHPSPQPGGE